MDIEIRELISRTDHSDTFWGVYRDDGLSKEVVVKKAHDSQSGQSFSNEHEALKELKHPNIVELIGADEKSKTLYLSAERGVCLRCLFENLSAPDLVCALSYLHQLSNVLGYIHDDSSHPAFVHYDISDGNFIIVDGKLVLLDFGTSYRLDRIPDSHRNALIGSLDSMSPEKFKRQPELGRESDVFAFGTIAYRLVTGFRPFSPEMGSVREQILHYGPLPPTTQIPELNQLIMACLSKDPKDRPRANELLDFFSRTSD
ncbi:MAG: protein kinase [SAR324 cluster bacterium]|uniref:Protein kinase n=1 Tax=SAR324 cluster bacterium TaxID=2024889 RepID=A0A7X9IIT9_9DELT|nr:protein kinase [SAR324 cluster bacterium]